MRPGVSAPFKPHILIAIMMFFFVVYSVFQDAWKQRVLLLIPITVLFVVFFAAYAYEARDMSTMAVEEYRKKEEKKGKAGI